MNLQPLETIDDPRIAVYRALPKSNLIRASGRFIAEGMTVVQRLLASEFEVESVLVAESALARLEGLAPADMPVFVAPKGLVSEIIGFRFHRGALACGRRKPPLKLADVAPARRFPAESPATLAVFPDIVDPENLGVNLRSCAALGVDAVLLGRGCADPFSRRVVRVSMGAVFSLPVFESADLASDLARLQADGGFDLVATVTDADAEPLATAGRTPRTALLFGSEGYGLGGAWIGRCARRITIPMSRGTDSLNVATACGVFLHHFLQVAKPIVSEPEKDGSGGNDSAN